MLTKDTIIKIQTLAKTEASQLALEGFDPASGDETASSRAVNALGYVGFAKHLGVNANSEDFSTACNVYDIAFKAFK